MKRTDLFIFIAVIVMIFVLFIVYLVASFFNTPQPEPLPTPRILRSVRPATSFNPVASVSPIAANASLAPSSNALTKEELVNLLPSQTDTFDVEYLSVSDHFVVTVKKDPYEANKAAAEAWLKSLGLDLKKLNIYWQSFPEVER